MKKPYLKKLSKISKFTVWIVNGKYIRDKMDEEFTNCGQHYQFNFIPENEFWIDRERVPGEEKYFIEGMLVMDRLISKGVSHNKACELAIKAERRERAKSLLMRKKLEKEEQEKDKIEAVHKKLLKKFSRGIKVWIVDGESVRNLFFVDFTEGGHDKVYLFIPKNEIWIDDDLNSREVKFVLLHELHERNLMAKGMEYDPAHESSSKAEYYCRSHPECIDEKLKEEIRKSPEL
jgi:hypothetical protein